MKTIMKAALGGTAFAVILALFALSCAPEAELTSRDWSEFNSERSAGLTDSPNHDTTKFPTVSFTNSQIEFPANNPGTTITDEQKELDITFPANADFLKVSNDKLEGEMKKFLSIYTYTNPKPQAGQEQYFLSNKKQDIDYEFVRRANKPNSVTKPDNTDAAKTTITIRLKSYDAIPSSAAQAAATGTETTTNAVMKIDSTKYKVGGYSLDGDNDGKAGEAIYDDYFKEINITDHSGGLYVPPGGGRVLNLEIGKIHSSSKYSFSTSSGATLLVTIATLKGDGIGDGSPAAAADTYNVRRKAVLEALIPNFKIQKFNGSKWEDVAVTINYQNNASPAAGEAAFGSLYTSLTVEDLGVYRIYASGLKGLKTSGLADLYGAEQKISIDNSYPTASTTPTLGLRGEYYISTNVGTYNSGAQGGHIFPDTVLATSTQVEIYDYNNAGKNATIKLTFDSIKYPDSTGSSYYLKEEAEIFKKYVRLAYDPVGKADLWDNSDPTDPKSLLTTKEVALVKINGVQFERVPKDTSQTQTGTKVIITPDNNLRVTDTLKNVFIVIAPNSELYGHNNITFGDFAAIDTVIDGIRGWKLYDNIAPGP